MAIERVWSSDKATESTRSKTHQISEEIVSHKKNALTNWFGKYKKIWTVIGSATEGGQRSSIP